MVRPSLYRKLTDEANPGLFSYTLEGIQMQFTGGKIEPRKVFSMLIVVN